MTLHHLKTWPEFFGRIWNGDKTCEVRKNDRNFTVGDVLVLHEWCPRAEVYLGRIVTVRVSYIIREPPFAPDGHVIMCFHAVPRLPLDLREEGTSEPEITKDDELVLREWKESKGGSLSTSHLVTDADLLRLIADCRANGHDLREAYDRHVRDVERQLEAHRKAADRVLYDFGDEYPGRLAPLRDLMGDD